MFTNYSQTYSAGILSLAGVVVLLGRSFGVEFAEQDLVFALGALANAGGVVWVLIHRFAKKDITAVGRRK